MKPKLFGSMMGLIEYIFNLKCLIHYKTCDMMKLITSINDKTFLFICQIAFQFPIDRVDKQFCNSFQIELSINVTEIDFLKTKIRNEQSKCEIQNVIEFKCSHETNYIWSDTELKLHLVFTFSCSHWIVLSTDEQQKLWK